MSSTKEVEAVDDNSKLKDDVELEGNNGEEAVDEVKAPIDESLLHGRLALNPRYGVSKWTAWFVLLFALIASGIFFVGQITAMWGLGGTVRVQLDDGTVMQKSYEPFEMSLMFSLKACIKTGLVPEVILGVVLFFFSGVWPHAKLWLMLYCWFGDLSHRFRHIILYWIASFGKFSFADPLSTSILLIFRSFSIAVSISSTHKRAVPSSCSLLYVV